jgi:hypothetical protein
LAVGDADRDAIDVEPAESPVKARRASHVVDDALNILLAREYLDLGNKHPPTLQRGHAREMVASLLSAGKLRS